MAALITHNEHHGGTVHRRLRITAWQRHEPEDRQRPSLLGSGDLVVTGGGMAGQSAGYSVRMQACRMFV